MLQKKKKIITCERVCQILMRVFHWPAPFCRTFCFHLKKKKKVHPPAWVELYPDEKLSPRLNNFGPWPWLCYLFCNIMFIPWFSSNLSSHTYFPVFFKLSRRLWKQMSQHNPERHFASWNYFQSFKRQYYVGKHFFFLLSHLSKS